MAAIVTHDLMVKVGEYKGQGGKVRNRYTKVGRVLRMDDGGDMYVLDRWFNPAGVPGDRDSIVLYRFEIQERQQPPQQQQQAPRGQTARGDFDGMDDDIPFANPYRGKRGYVV